MERKKDIIWLLPPFSVLVCLFMMRSCVQRIDTKYSVIKVRKEKRMTVPSKSIVRIKGKRGERSYIYIVDNENRVTEKEVIPGPKKNGKIEIYNKDLKEGVEIIETPDEKIRNNIIIKRKTIKERKEEKEKRIKKLQTEIEKRKKEIEDNEIEIIKLKKGEI